MKVFESETFRVVASGLISAVATVALGATTGTFQYFNKNRELDIRMVDVALTILSAKDEGTKTLEARKYAIRLLSKYGGVEIADKEMMAWASEGQLPIGDWPAIQGKIFYEDPSFQKGVNDSIRRMLEGPVFLPNADKAK